ncbi:uncharacterized protein LOC129378156 [Poeciliopsis prolifica]|uniref:uncharacterized protein LOC129378156 n=1 Tax=Poeciliopsis prolifica TaxID=188132 RepID=UPI002413D951|nr:uncharacterized protein LOC129378156 [Poeciliopsis prolifica]
MYKRLTCCVLLVMLSGRFGGTYAETNVTTAQNTTTHPTNMSITSANSTMTTPMMNVSMTASTQLVPNNTVVTLESNITKAECGSKQLCVSEPSNCEPSVPGSCFFLAANLQNDGNFNFGLSGESDGYIAATLTGGVGEGDPTYVCANSKGKVKFFSTILTNGVLNISTLNVTSVKGKINGRTIQCSFVATVPQPRARVTLGLAVSTGAYNDTNESLGLPKTVIRVTSVDLANSTLNVTNEITSTTTPPPTGNNATTGVSIPQLSTNITRQSCGSTKLCAAEPKECNPAVGGSCYFLSVKQQNGQTYNFELSGQSDGYVAAGLSTGVTQNGTHTAYICANNNGNVTFFTGTIENLEIKLKSQNSSNEQGTVDGSKIQCRFTADLPDTTVRAADYALSVSTGTFDAANSGLGKANFRILTNRVNLSDPTATIINLLNNAPNYAPSFLPALLVTVCMLAFTAM